MRTNSVDIVIKMLHIVKDKNKLELLINLWLDLWSVMLVVEDGDSNDCIQ